MYKLGQQSAVAVEIGGCSAPSNGPNRIAIYQIKFELLRNIESANVNKNLKVKVGKSYKVCPLLEKGLKMQFEVLK